MDISSLDLLNECLLQFRRDNYRHEEAHGIIMNPETWWKIFDEVLGRQSMEIDHHMVNTLFKGIKVFRSIDIEDNLFRIF